MLYLHQVLLARHADGKEEMWPGGLPAPDEFDDTGGAELGGIETGGGVGVAVQRRTNVREVNREYMGSKNLHLYNLT